jgi:subtilisin family serine protease
MLYKQLLKTALVAVFALLLTIPSFAKDKIKIEKLDDLPRYTYKIDKDVVDFIGDEKEVLKLAKKLKKNLKKDLDTYEIEDKTTLKSYYAMLGTIALLEKKYDEYLNYLQLRKDLEEKDAIRLTMGLFTQSYIKAIKSGTENFEANMTKNLNDHVSSLPYEIVEAEIKSSKGSAEIYSEALLLGQAKEAFQPILDGSDGEMSQDIARSIVGMRYTIDYFLPFKHIMVEVYGDYITANATEKEDIWKERDIEFPAGQEIDPVVVAIWDSGVDSDIFVPLGQMWVNESEIPDNNIDDDNNGFVDDIYGIAYTLHSDKTENLLYEIGDVKDRPRLQRLMKGLEDLTSAIDSEEASELKKSLSQIDQSEVKPFIEDISKYGNYAHGTHVAGIAAAGNPYIKLLATRLTFGHTMIPELPTIENAHKEAKMYAEVIKYYKENGVRVVNMSWGGNVAGIEGALEANNAGGTPEERKALARDIFEIGKVALYDAIKSAPEILFVTSAGNSDNDVVFEEFLPSSFDLPNIISIGAVDQAGDETSFTSFGKVDVYANGFEVESYVPGGDRMPMSGTSMSSPNVVNLVAKMLVVKPDLTPEQIIDLIVKASDEKMAGDRKVTLIHPKKTISMLATM